MISRFRKFSNSIYSKIFLFIVAIPFVFWGMGDLFSGGNRNTIVKIGKGKIKTDQFINFVKFNGPVDSVNLNRDSIEKLFSQFIGQILINYEVEDMGIQLTDNSLGKIIQNQKIFIKDNKFSRLEYEKFLIKNGIGAVAYEATISEQIKKEQLLNYVAGGLVNPNFLVNKSYNKIKQKRNIKLINLNDVFKDKLNFSEKNIKDYFENNKEKYKKELKTVKFIKLDPKTLTGTEEFNDLFFKKIDEIDNIIVEGQNINFVVKKFDLKPHKTVTFDINGKNESSDANSKLPDTLLKKIFYINNNEPILMIEYDDKYFLFEFIKHDKVQKKISDSSVKANIILNLERETKKQLLSDLISKTRSNNFKKVHFDKFANDKNLEIKKISLAGIDSNEILDQGLVNQIYAYPEKKIMVATDINLSKNYLIYIDEIKNVVIEKNSADYQKYSEVSNAILTNNLFNTYDNYLKKKYKIDINYKALDYVNNYFK